jgi:hypothetical protein
MNPLELKVPPVALTLIFAAIMWLVSAYVPALAFTVSWSTPVAVVFVALGLAISLPASRSFPRPRRP